MRRFPNVSSLDLSVIRNTIGAIVDRVTVAIRFLGVFCLAIGIPVLFSAVAATRRARLREGVLLRTLGASRALVQRVLFTEYAALGVLGAFTGMLLAFGGAWALMHWVFEDTFVPAWGAAAAHHRRDGDAHRGHRTAHEPRRAPRDAHGGAARRVDAHAVAHARTNTHMSHAPHGRVRHV